MSRREGKQILKDAEAAGEKYVQEQLGGDYFHQWVWEQMVEADRMRKEDPSSVIPLKSKSDLRKLARNMLQQLSWDTKRDLDTHTILDLSGASGVFGVGNEAWVQTKYGVTASDVTDAFYDGFNRALDAPATRDWLADELIGPMLRELRSKQSEAKEPSRRVPAGRRVVRDYIAVGHDGRPIAGPFTDYGQAKRAADRAGGYVKFASVAGEDTQEEARRRRRSGSGRSANWYIDVTVPGEGKRTLGPYGSRQEAARAAWRRPDWERGRPYQGTHRRRN